MLSFPAIMTYDITKGVVKGCSSEENNKIKIAILQAIKEVGIDFTMKEVHNYSPEVVKLIGSIIFPISLVLKPLQNGVRYIKNKLSRTRLNEEQSEIELVRNV